jgi:adenylate cyclase
VTLQESGSGIYRRNARLASGLVLFAYVATHLANHTLGLISLDAAEAGRLWFLGFWRSVPAALLLYAAFTVHIALALQSLYERRTLRMPPPEALRLLLGFALPWLLAEHYAGTQLAHAIFGLDDRYALVAGGLWRRDASPRVLLLITLAWSHGCVGLHLAMRHRPAYKRGLALWFAIALLLPVLGFLGYVSMGREIELRALEPAWLAARLAGARPLDAAQSGLLDRIADLFILGLYAAVAGVLLLRAGRGWRERHGGQHVAISYPGTTVRVPRGWSVLEASRANGIAHLSMCGGRARCSTCRVRVEAGLEHCPPPKRIESRTLVRIGAAPGVRLACQLRPTGAVRVTPLLPALRRDGSAPGAQFNAGFGDERDLVILFIDLRRWTTLSEQQLPFDLVYVLEQYFEAVGEAVREAGGEPNQFIGDSVMAIFGLEVSQAQACRQALAAARAIEIRLAAWSERLREEFGQGVDFGIGLHAGRAAVGWVGYQDTRTLSAVGDAINTASRLQELTKTHAAHLVLSEPVARGAGLDTAGLATEMVNVRGRATPLRIYAVPVIAALPASTAGA